jgi:hypothetical protein
MVLGFFLGRHCDVWSRCKNKLRLLCAFLLLSFLPGLFHESHALLGFFLLTFLDFL